MNAIDEVTEGFRLFTERQYDDALGCFQRAVLAREDHENLAELLHHIGLCLWSQGRYEEAETRFVRAMRVARRHNAADLEVIAQRLSEVGLGHLRAARHDDARPWFEREAAILSEAEGQSGAAPQRLAGTLYLVGVCHLRDGLHEDALPWFEKALAANQRTQGPVDEDDVGKSEYMVGVCHARAQRFERALEWFERASASARRGDLHGRVHPEYVVRAQQAIAETRQRMT